NRRRHTRSKRDWSSDVCSSDLKVSGKMLGFGKKKAKDNATEPMQTVDELDDKEGVEPEQEAPVTPLEAESESEQPAESPEPSKSVMPEIKAQIEIPTYGILVSEGGTKSLHTIEDVSETERYEKILSEMYHVDADAAGRVFYPVHECALIDLFDEVNYLVLMMAQSLMFADFRADTMLVRSVVSDADFAYVRLISVEG